MMPLPHAVTTDAEVDEMLEAIVRLTQIDLPFLAQVAQIALQARSMDEREQALVSLYRLGLEQQQPYVADLTDELLCWIEEQRDAAA